MDTGPASDAHDTVGQTDAPPATSRQDAAVAGSEIEDAGTTHTAADDAGDDERPVTDDRHPADVVNAMVDHVLDLAATWTKWDGRPLATEDRIYTPHKAVRRVADHMVDHLAEIEARLAGVPTIPDRWHASAITTDADQATFTQEDLDEARSRLTRLAQIWDVRLRALTEDRLDCRGHDPNQWTLREVAFHLTESTFYADSVGRL